MAVSDLFLVQRGSQGGPGGSRRPGRCQQAREAPREGQEEARLPPKPPKTTWKTNGKHLKPSPKAPWPGKFPDGPFCTVQQTRNCHMYIIRKCTRQSLITTPSKGSQGEGSPCKTYVKIAFSILSGFLWLYFQWFSYGLKGFPCKLYRGPPVSKMMVIILIIVTLLPELP